MTSSPWAINPELISAHDTRFLVYWTCEKCGLQMSGWLMRGESSKRICKSSYAKGIIGSARVKRNGVIVPYVCNGNMAVTTDERPAQVVSIEQKRLDA